MERSCFLSFRFDPGFRFTEYPGDREARRHALLVLDERAVGKCRAVQGIPFYKSADPELPVAFAERGDQLGTGITPAGAVGWTVRGGEGLLDAVEIPVIAPIGNERPGKETEIPSRVTQGVRDIEVQVRVK